MSSARGERPRRLRLPHPRLALEQQRLRQPQREEHGRGEPLVGEIVRAVQPARDGVRVGQEAGERRRGARARHGVAAAASTAS